ncbi:MULTISPECIES: phosphoenolpyruvate synthase [unclassified Variovorax]|uniref:phosphoenolpyruvate synthase n=1 Tax=unclassified Variovorax TaxID=663243 RepID=UPI00076D4A45|nr:MULTISPECIES: phosphoenolpyruvate synthase [unclassified Variovorax]KWT73310.1 Phosphoenolpyruvate synthase [Variovorax sp. WDL1]PNG47157.1 Phosphoenolpyruvate synthase [Variovorax sp. B2]PNG48192.1 Phosphoenolpyruvate synthase [Variovorax sp. B4]VTV15032.1 Phosphoenolpyruvate synthase [Variovorax sp. WDL1]
MMATYIRWFSEIGADDVASVGGKNASLGEMYRALTPHGVHVPNGFAITAEAYRRTLELSGAMPRLRDALAGLDVQDIDDLAQRAQRAREIVLAATLPEELTSEIRTAYARLRAECGADMSVAVRSSATAEDLPTASFAGQHESFLNISGEARLLDSVRLCFASLFKDRAIAYRVDKGFDHFKVFQSVCVMQMVRSDRAASGVIFTLDTDTGFRDVVFITGAYGLGENVVQGTVDPDEFYVFKPTLKLGRRAVLRRKLGRKEVRLVYSKAAGKEPTCNLPTAPEDQARYCIDDADVLALADAAVVIEDHYSRHAGRPTPMDIEWAKDGLDGRIYIVQARPETVASRKPLDRIDEHRLHATAAPVVTGRAVGATVAVGRARVITDVLALGQFQPGEILVADTTMPDWGTVMKIAAAVVTNRGGRTCHAAIVARELGIPAVIGCDDATAKIRTGDEVTVSCAEGAEGRVYAGAVPFEKTSVDLSALGRPETHLMVNLGNPDSAFQTARLPTDGVGLARMEFIVAEHIKVHPMALVHPEKVADPAQRAEIARLTRGFERPADYFVRELSEGVGMIAAAFNPKPVIVRMSDFKTNEYASLLGGSGFEPKEENPMIGFRGASRYTHPAYAEGFALECAAMKRVREEMGLVNVKLMIPFCRRVQEAERVLEAMASHGLRRGDAGLEIYVMCEIPNNVIQVDAFARLFDGFSIGSNDLTQLVLGVDRDSRLVAFDFDERDDGVKAMIRQAVEGAQRNGRHVGICGQAPSDYPEMAAYLVELGIDSMSVTPDTLLKTTRDVLAVEERLGRPPRQQPQGSSS